MYFAKKAKVSTVLASTGISKTNTQPIYLDLTKTWRADGSDDGPERKWPVGVAAGQLEFTGRRGRRRAWQIGRFGAVNRTLYAVFRNVFFFRTIVEVSK